MVRTRGERMDDTYDDLYPPRPEDRIRLDYLRGLCRMRDEEIRRLLARIDVLENDLRKIEATPCRST